MDNWTDNQIKYLIAQWDDAIGIHYPQYARMWQEPEENFRCLKEVWNLLDAAKVPDWDVYLAHGNMTVLDIGGGTGWLSAYLSNHEKIEKIFLLDSSQFFLERMLPEIVKLMEGKQEKIVPIKGLFAPLLFENDSLDMVVASSSLHHAENLENVLKEIQRVLKKNGKLIILNETPYSDVRYVSLIIKKFMEILKTVLLHEYKSVSVNISSSGCLCDPYLGDKCYPLWYWQKAIERSGFSLSRVIKTEYLTNKKDTSGIRLTHFICDIR